MRVEQLEYVAAVTRLGLMRRASEALRVSQPALSQTINNLERGAEAGTGKRAELVSG
jgi:DNA-binding transcriptional LysR family regulator